MFAQGLESLVNDVDKSHFRPLQKESFLCQARCCDSAQTQADLRNWCVTPGPSATSALYTLCNRAEASCSSYDRCSTVAAARKQQLDA